MVVENTRDLAAYEKTGKYDGVYHVLHGAISPMLGIGPGDIKLKELMTRLQGDVNEVIIATNSSLEGETTAMYISKLIKRPVSKSAGSPAGYRWAEIWNILMKLLCCVPWKAAWSCNEDKMHVRSVMQFQVSVKKGYSLEQFRQLHERSRGKSARRAASRQTAVLTAVPDVKTEKRMLRFRSQKSHRLQSDFVDAGTGTKTSFAGRNAAKMFFCSKGSIDSDQRMIRKM